MCPQCCLARCVKLSTIGAAAWSPLGWWWSPLTAQGLEPGVQVHPTWSQRPHSCQLEGPTPSPHKATQDKS